MKCPTCGEVNEAGYRFCRVCGHPLSVEEAAGPTVAMPTAPSGGEESVRHGGDCRSALRSPRFPTQSALPDSFPAAHSVLPPKGLSSAATRPNARSSWRTTKSPASMPGWALNEAGQVVLRDRDSANGSFVNQVRVQEAVLNPNDEVSFGAGGKHLFRVESFVQAPAAVGGAKDGHRRGRWPCPHLRRQPGGYCRRAAGGSFQGRHGGHQAHRSHGPPPR